jgi:hypothetical protein
LHQLGRGNRGRRRNERWIRWGRANATGDIFNSVDRDVNRHFAQCDGNIGCGLRNGCARRKSSARAGQCPQESSVQNAVYSNFGAWKRSARARICWLNATLA